MLKESRKKNKRFLIGENAYGTYYLNLVDNDRSGVHFFLLTASK